MGSELIPSGLKYIADNIISRQNILGISNKQKASWAKELELPNRAETILFAGCGYQFSSQLETLISLIRRSDESFIGTGLPMRLAGLQKKLGLDLTGIYSKILAKTSGFEEQPLIAAVQVLQSLGIQPGYLAEDEPCCGALLYYAGMHQEFALNAQQACEKFKSFGVRKVISVVPSCTHAILTLFPQYVDSFDLEVKHFLEVVCANVSSHKLQFPRHVKVTYHDPCQLSRYLKLVEEPRQILRSIRGIELVETEWTKGEWSTCCGGGGGFEAIFPELSQILAVNRVKELLATGAEIIVTQCPGCILQLKDGLKEIKSEAVKVLDLAQVIAAALES